MNSWQAPVAYRPVTFVQSTRSAPPSFKKKKKLGRPPPPLPASTLKTSIMWSSNQLSHILHSSCVRSRQRFLRGFLLLTAALLPLPPHDKMFVPPRMSMWYLINKLWFILPLMRENIYNLPPVSKETSSGIYLWQTAPGLRQNQLSRATVPITWNS